MWTVFICLGIFFSCRFVSSEEQKNDYYALLFVVDALHPALFEQMIEQGELPNIKRYLYDRGLIGKNFSTVFPSVSAPAITSIMTGVYPGRHKIVNFQWFDRSKGLFRSYIGSDIFLFDSDVKKNTRVVFDHFDQGDTASFGMITGTNTGNDDSLLFTALNPFHRFAPVTHLMLSDIFAKFKLREGIPHLMALYEWGVDHRGHRTGAFSGQVKTVMKRLDIQVGKLVDEYKKRGLFDRTYLILISDHGLGTVTRNFNLDELLQDARLKKKLISYNLGASYFPLTIERWDSLLALSNDIRGYNAIVGSNAGGTATLDFVKNGGYTANDTWNKDLWKDQVVYDDLIKYYLGPQKGYINLIEFLKGVEGIDFFIVRDRIFNPPHECSVRVVSKRGESRISRTGADSHTQEYKYELLSGDDPLGYTQHPATKALMDGKYHPQHDWLIASQHLLYPDACVQLVQVFDTDLSGSVILSCADDWGVNSKVVTKHGGYTKDEFFATFCMAGPGLQKGVLTGARTVDATPSLLYLLNKKFSEDEFDGVVMPEARKAFIVRGQ